jgi:hypothetical protein
MDHLFHQRFVCCFSNAFMLHGVSSSYFCADLQKCSSIQHVALNILYSMRWISFSMYLDGTSSKKLGLSVDVRLMEPFYISKSKRFFYVAKKEQEQLTKNCYCRQNAGAGVANMNEIVVLPT